MEIDEKTKVSLGVVGAMMTGCLPVIRFITNKMASKEYVETQVEGISSRLDKLDEKMSVIDHRIFEIQKMLVEMNRKN